MGVVVKIKDGPAWLRGLLAEETFFGSCGDHHDRRKNDKNIFCLSCCRSICPHCLPSHRPHPLLQVRRYVYHDVVRLGDLEKLIDCSYIQPYTINGAKVIFLNQRPQSRTCKGSANICFNCDRILQEPFHFCSLQCKVQHLVYQGEDLSGIVRNFTESDFAISHFEGLRVDMMSTEFADEDQHVQMTSNNNVNGNNVRESSSLMHAHNNQYHEYRKGSSSSSPSCYNNELEAMIPSRGNHQNHQGQGNIKKEKKPNLFPAGIVLSFSSRRKGAPHRAPLS